MSFVLRVLISGVALWLAEVLLPGISIIGADTTWGRIGVILLVAAVGVVYALHRTRHDTAGTDPAAAPADQPDGAAPTAGTTLTAPLTPRPVNPRKRGPVLFWFALALMAVGLGALAIADAISPASAERAALSSLAASTLRSTTKAKSRRTGWNAARSSAGLVRVGRLRGAGIASITSSKATTGPSTSSVSSVEGCSSPK